MEKSFINSITNSLWYKIEMRYSNAQWMPQPYLLVVSLIITIFYWTFVITRWFVNQQFTILWPIYRNIETKVGSCEFLMKWYCLALLTICWFSKKKHKTIQIIPMIYSWNMWNALGSFNLTIIWFCLWQFWEPASVFYSPIHSKVCRKNKYTAIMAKNRFVWNTKKR